MIIIIDRQGDDALQLHIAVKLDHRLLLLDDRHVVIAEALFVGADALDVFVFDGDGDDVGVIVEQADNDLGRLVVLGERVWAVLTAGLGALGRLRYGHGNRLHVLRGRRCLSLVRFEGFAEAGGTATARLEHLLSPATLQYACE